MIYERFSRRAGWYTASYVRYESNKTSELFKQRKRWPPDKVILLVRYANSWPISHHPLGLRRTQVKLQIHMSWNYMNIFFQNSEGHPLDTKSGSEKAWEGTTCNRPVTLTQNMFHASEITRSQDLPLKYLYKSRVHVLGNDKWKQWESCVSGKRAIWPYILSNISHIWPEYFHDRGQVTIWTYYRDFLEITSLLHINIY